MTPAGVPGSPARHGHPCGAHPGQALIEDYECAGDGSGVRMRFRIISLEGTPHER